MHNTYLLNLDILQKFRFVKDVQYSLFSVAFYLNELFNQQNKTFEGTSSPPVGGALPYMGYIGMCGPKGYGFLAVLVIIRVSILADFGHLVINRIWFLYSSLDIFKTRFTLEEIFPDS